MSNNKQSSVDFLLKELEEIGVLNIKNCHWSDEVDVKKAIEQAKEIHRQQILQAYKAGWEECINSKYLPVTYYEKTYNNQQ